MPIFEKKKSSIQSKEEGRNLLTTQEDFEAKYDLEDHTKISWADALTDKITAFYGSWAFVGIQSFILVFWVLFNVAFVALGWFHRPWDVYPFVFMNLLLSTEAAYSGIFVLMSNNRADKNQSILSAEMRATSNRAWSNTERIEILTELLLTSLQESIRQDIINTDKISTLIGDNRKSLLEFIEFAKGASNDHFQSVSDKQTELENKLLSLIALVQNKE